MSSAPQIAQQTQQPTKLNIQLESTWSPHHAQADIRESDIRFRVAVAGRRFGKTKLARHEIFEYAVDNPETVCWWVGPSYDDANDLGYTPLKKTIPDPLIADFRRQKPRKIELINGAVISFRSADRPESLRGRGVDYVVIDEAGLASDHIWNEEIRPALSDNLGHMLAIGTPKTRNWFFNWYHRGQDPDVENTASWRFETYDNPHIIDSEIDEAREELPDRVFKQEYLAQFVDDAGAVFGRIHERNVQPYPLDATAGQAPYLIGVDLGRAQNFSAITVLDTSGLLVHAERLRGDSWESIGNAIERVATHYAPGTVRIDATRDNALIEELQRSVGIAITPVRFTAQTKRDLIENLAAKLELGEIMISEHAEELINELTAYTYETTRAGNVRYLAPEGTHDDFVDSLALSAKPPESTSGAWA